MEAVELEGVTTCPTATLGSLSETPVRRYDGEVIVTPREAKGQERVKSAATSSALHLPVGSENSH